MTGLAGTRRLTDTTRRLLGVPVWAHQGSSRIRQAPVVDPALIRALDVGQAAYIYRGGVTFIQVKRLVGGPAALAGPAWVVVASGQRPGRLAQAPTTGQAARPPPGMAPASPAPGRPLPDVSELLDEAFGAEASP